MPEIRNGARCRGGIGKVLNKEGISSSLQPDFGSHYRSKPEAGGHVVRSHLTSSVRQEMKQLGDLRRTIRVHPYPDGSRSLLLGPGKLATDSFEG